LTSPSLINLLNLNLAPSVVVVRVLVHRDRRLVVRQDGETVRLLVELDAGFFAVADLVVEDELGEGVEELRLDGAVERTGTDCEEGGRRKRKGEGRVGERQNGQS
jgi:hypothetical protein